MGLGLGVACNKGAALQPWGEQARQNARLKNCEVSSPYLLRTEFLAGGDDPRSNPLGEFRAMFCHHPTIHSG